MEGSITKSVKLPSFSGLRKDFQSCWERSIAYASVGKFSVAPSNGGESTTPSTETEARHVSYTHLTLPTKRIV